MIVGFINNITLRTSCKILNITGSLLFLRYGPTTNKTKYKFEQIVYHPSNWFIHSNIIFTIHALENHEFHRTNISAS